MPTLLRRLISILDVGSLKLHHLCFVDGLMMFSKIDIDLVRVLCQRLDKFASTSSLHANKNKSAIYFVGFPLEVREDITF